jgi:hypothetical protein
LKELKFEKFEKEFNFKSLKEKKTKPPIHSSLSLSPFPARDPAARAAQPPAGPPLIFFLSFSFLSRAAQLLFKPS